MLKGFAAFVEYAAQADSERVFVFDLFDRIDESQGETVAELLQPLFEKGVEIHATSMRAERAAVQTALAAAVQAGYRTKITKAQER